jgi:glycosyltransferase involved in cell wall biosynthesis
MKARAAPQHVLVLGTERIGKRVGRAPEQRLRMMAAVCPHTVYAYHAPGGASPPEIPGIRFVLIPSRWRTPIRQAVFAAGVFVVIARLRWRGTPLIVMTQSPFEAVPAALSKMVLNALNGRGPAGRVRLVVHVQGDWIEVLRLLYRPPRLLVAVARMLSRFALTNADAVRCVSDFTARKAAEYSRAPTLTFPAHTDLEFFLSARPAGPDERLHVLFAGALTPVKGVDVLLRALAEAVARGAKSRLLVAGDGPERSRLAALAAVEGVADRVQFLGHLEHVALRELMRSAIVLVLPSRSEGLPLVVLEAMASGTAVIGSRVGGIEEIVRDGWNGVLVAPNDPHALAEALIALVKDPSVATTMGRRGRAVVEQRSTPGAWLEAYRALIGLALGR